MSVLLVTQDFPPDCGGIQTYCWELARHLVAEGERVRVLCPTPEWRAGAAPGTGDQDLTRTLLTEGPPVDRLAVPGSFLFAPLAMRIRAYLERYPSINTILYAQWPSALWQLRAPQLAARYRRLCLVHGRELLKTVLGPFTRPLAARVLASMDEVFPVSGRVRELVEALRLPGEVRVGVMPPGVDPARFRPIDARLLARSLGVEEARVVLSLSRLARRKNLDGLLRAFALVKAQVSAAMLLVGGDGPERARLEGLARDWGLSGSVRFLGQVAADELPALYNLAEAFVLPSRDRRRDIEGFGITLLEAGACERPVVAGRAGGMADAVLDGETGLVVDSSDDRALAGGILSLLQDPERARRLGQAARLRVLRELTWTHCARRIAERIAATEPAIASTSPAVASDGEASATSRSASSQRSVSV